MPDELIEAARVDGCSTLRIFWNVVLPALRPAAAVLGLLTFMATWNDFFWPLRRAQRPGEPDRAAVAVAPCPPATIQDYSLSLDRHAIATVPLLVVFVLLRQVRSSAASWKVR